MRRRYVWEEGEQNRPNAISLQSSLITVHVQNRVYRMDRVNVDKAEEKVRVDQ